MGRVVHEFGDVPYSPKWARKKVEGRTPGDAARAKLDALRSLAVGMPAPEITGEDVTTGEAGAVFELRPPRLR